MTNKVTIIGAGMVGATTAYSLIVRDMTEEIALVDLNTALAEAQVMDLQHAVPFTTATKVKVGDYSDCKDSRVVMITCGVAQKPGESRLDLVKKNAAIMRDIVPKVFEQNPDAVLIMVTNPVDVLTYLAIQMFPDKQSQILGSGTILDSARLRHLLAQRLGINPKSIHAYVVGEHGDSEVALWSTATVGNMLLKDMDQLTESDLKDIFEQAKNAAYAIIAGKQSTYYAIGSGGAQLIETILHNKNTVLPVSHLMTGEYELSDVCLSMPAIVGAKGIMGKLKLNLSWEEHASLVKSAETLKAVIAELG